MSDPLIWILPAVVFLICFFFVRAKLKRLENQNAILNQKLVVEMQKVNRLSQTVDDKSKEITVLKTSLAEIEKKPNLSRELVDFMMDLKINGYGVVRIDPDSVFYRGTR